MEKCMEKAKESGCCFATVNNGCHYGFGGYFPMKAAEEGFIGFCVANGPSMVAPFGGADPVLSTNPISVAIPGSKTMFVMDMATSLVAKGKISLALKEGKSIPEGWALDKDGNPTTDPAAANVGVLLPMGGPKGYGLGLMVSLLTCALANSDFDTQIPRFWEQPEIPTNIGYFMGAIDISKFLPLEQFKANADMIFKVLKETRTAPGFSEVMIPGEIEKNLTDKNMAEGIDLSEATLKEFKELSERYGVEYCF